MEKNFEKWEIDNIPKFSNEKTIQMGAEFEKRMHGKDRNGKETNIVKKESCWLDVTKHKSLITNDRKKHKKVFFFIVDALRLDFMVNKEEIILKEGSAGSELRYNVAPNRETFVNNYENKKESVNGEGENEVRNKGENDSPSSSFDSDVSTPTSPYNKFKNMHKLLRNNATQTAFFGFRADPPTVTSQRLKGAI